MSVAAVISEKDISSRVFASIAEVTRVKQGDIRLDQNFVNDLGCDSLDSLEILMFVEGEFEIEIPDEEAEKILTVGQLVEAVQHAYQG